MRKKVINSQLSNVKTFQMYYRQMKNLAENVFKFNNLPEYIDLSYLNRTLLNNGAIAFFKDEILDEVIALPFSSYGSLDMYGRPINIYVEGQNNYRRYLKAGEYVIMYDNTSRYSLKLDIAQLAERIALCVRTQDVNIVHQRTPRIWKCDSNTEKSVKDTINEIDSNVETVVSTKDSAFADIQGVLNPAPYVTDKIDEHLDKLWAQFYALIGVANLSIQKKERLITDEMVATQGGTIVSRYSRFEPRQRAIEKINKMFGLDMSVEYYDGEPSTEDGKDENDDVSDDVSADTVSM